MRYWIYWNDLVQGPFEVEELVSLRAFTADLPVCEEDHQEWAPVAAVSELLRYLQPTASVYAGLPLPPPPPPPPAQPPVLSPLQGEFFVEPAGQQHLFDLNGTKHYAFRSAQDPVADVAEPMVSPLSSPFHFFSAPTTDFPVHPPASVTPVESSPILQPVEEMELGVVEPEEGIEPEPKTAAVPVVEPPQEIVSIPPAQPVIESEPEAAPDVDIFPPIFEPPEVEVKTRLWPWVLGVWAMLGIIGFAFYMHMNRVPPAMQLPEPARVMPEVTLPPAEPVAEKIFPPPPVEKKIISTPVVKKVIPKPLPKPVVKKPTPAPVMESLPVPAAEPPKATDVETLKPLPQKAPPAVVPAAHPTKTAPDKWRDREQEAIDLTLKQKIYAGQRTVGENARLILENLHEKELLYAADTGERLYAPDKITWSALHEEGPRYRVYLNFLAWQANGERTLSRSDQFSVDLLTRKIQSLDEGTTHDFYDAKAMLMHQHSPKAGDIQNLLNGVDVLNKNKLHAVIMKADKQKDDKKNAAAELKASEDKLRREIIYFRTKYAEKALQNIAKAYGFSAFVNGK